MNMKAMTKLKKDKPVRHAVRIKRTAIPNIKHWNVIGIALLLLTAFWHLENTIGWLTGDTMVKLYGMDAPLASTIIADPFILFYTTHLTLGISLLMLIFTVVMIYVTLVEKLSVPDALAPVLLCSIITAWAFPIFHAILDLAATVLKTRDTSGFDVFQLGIDMIPMFVISGVCVFLMWVNRRVDILTQ